LFGSSVVILLKVFDQFVECVHHFFFVARTIRIQGPTARNNALEPVLGLFSYGWHRNEP